MPMLKPNINANDNFNDNVNVPNCTNFKYTNFNFKKAKVERQSQMPITNVDTNIES